MSKKQTKKIQNHRDWALQNLQGDMIIITNTFKISDKKTKKSTLNFQP